MLSTLIYICLHVCRLFSALEDELSMAWRHCWGARCSVFAVARYPIALVSTSSLLPRSTLNTSLYECLYGLCLYLLVHVRLIERNDVQMFKESSVGVLASMSKRSSLVSNVMHSVRHALHNNLQMFECLQAVFGFGR